MPRGGRRTGTPGKSYSNRTDLNVPAMAAKGQQYGKAGDQLASQRALPVARPATDAVPGVSPAGPGGRSVPSAPASPMPSDITGLDVPSARPGEPVTSGLPVGPGAGPEALGAFSEQGDGAEDLAQYLPMLEFMASQPGASAQTRNFVRRLRGAAPTPGLT